MSTPLEKRTPLNNVQRLAVKRGVHVTMLYDIDKHKYRGVDGRVHYVPYCRPAVIANPRGGTK